MSVAFARELNSCLIRPEQVIDVCLLAAKRGKISVTRRAAGLWPAAKAALLAELIVSPANQVGFCSLPVLLKVERCGLCVFLF